MKHNPYNYWNGKKVIITGASGFIGSHLTETLVEKGATVTALVHYNSRSDIGLLGFLKNDLLNNIKIVFCDIKDFDFLFKHFKDQEIVFHLASLIGIPYSYMAPKSYIETNIIGTYNVLQAALLNNIQKIIHTSTSEVYGTAKYVPIDEKHPLCAQSPYSATKIAADKLAESFHDSFELPVDIIRPFNTFGPRQSARAIIPSIIAQALTQNHLEVGSLTPQRDMNYVKDTVSGFLKVAEMGKSNCQVYNVGSGITYSIKEILNKILRLLNLDLEIKVNNNRKRPKKSEVMILQCNSQKIINELEWKKQYKFEEGLLKTIDFIKKNLKMYETKGYIT